jgi:leucyl-tRNA synthetase
VKSNQDLRVDFSEQDLDRMRDQAVEHIVDWRKRMGQPLSSAQVRQQIKQGKPVMAMGVDQEMIAGADNADEVLDALDKLSKSNSTEAVEVLETFTTDTWRAQRKRSAPLGKLSVVDPRP